MEKALVFVDAGFLSKVGLYFGGNLPLKYDLIKFVKNISGNEGLILKQLFYYNAPPFQPTKPTRDEKRRKEKYDSFIARLNSSPEITVREGRVQRVKNDGKYVYKQKGVDTLLTMDLMDVPLEHPKVKKIILIASDSDFVPVIERLKSRGIEVILYTYFDRKRRSIFSTSNKLLKSVNRYVQLTEMDFTKSKF